MKQFIFKTVFFGALITSLSTHLVAFDTQECSFTKVDFPLIDKFINTKRSIPYSEKCANLKIFGDIRADWLWREERDGPIALRGGGARDRRGIPLVPDQIEGKVNLMSDYSCKDFWGFMNMEFANLYGLDAPETDLIDDEFAPQLLFGSGFCNVICLKRMFAGMTLWKEDTKKLDLEIGRKALYYNFDSRIQYKARVDGLFLRFSNQYAKYAEGRSSDYYAKGMLFLIDYVSNYFGAVAETGVYNLFDSGFDWKYSIINWRNKKPNRCGFKDPDGWRFVNSQITVDYNFKKPVLGKKLNLYGAFVFNHTARQETFLELAFLNGALIPDNIPLPDNLGVINPDKENAAWYLGFIWGEVRKQGDLSFDCNYQYVEAQAVPECDIRGIGRGNIMKESFSASRRGNGNFKGVHLELLYALTDTLSVDLKFEYSRSVDSRIGGGNHKFDKIELEIIQKF